MHSSFANESSTQSLSNARYLFFVCIFYLPFFTIFLPFFAFSPCPKLDAELRVLDQVEQIENNKLNKLKNTNFKKIFYSK